MPLLRAPPVIGHPNSQHPWKQQTQPVKYQHQNGPGYGQQYGEENLKQMPDMHDLGPAQQERDGEDEDEDLGDRPGGHSQGWGDEESEEDTHQPQIDEVSLDKDERIAEQALQGRNPQTNTAQPVKDSASGDILKAHWAKNRTHKAPNPDHLLRHSTSSVSSSSSTPTRSESPAGSVDSSTAPTCTSSQKQAVHNSQTTLNDDNAKLYHLQFYQHCTGPCLVPESDLSMWIFGYMGGQRLSGSSPRARLAPRRVWMAFEHDYAGEYGFIVMVLVPLAQFLANAQHIITKHGSCCTQCIDIVSVLLVGALNPAFPFALVGFWGKEFLGFDVKLVVVADERGERELQSGRNSHFF
ncbi:hypothetical protein C8J57DRAFT_1227250 [Mycena rebaudengoi]|nr:hypothetical protein C8J57DRAFT_1227250 [Mycena rebaudengoi]